MTMKFVTVLFLLPLISVLLICCTSIDTAQAKDSEKLPNITEATPIDPAEPKDSEKLPNITESTPIDPAEPKDSDELPNITEATPIDPAEPIDSEKLPNITESTPIDPAEPKDNDELPNITEATPIDPAEPKDSEKLPNITEGIDVNDDPTINVNGENPRPIIGILSQEVLKETMPQYPGKNITSYIAGSFVKFVEGAGGRVLPIWIGKAREYYQDIMNKINGVLLPGGPTLFNESFGYAHAGQHLYEIAVEMNDVNNYMPIWSICSGFGLLVYLSANNTDFRITCSSTSQALKLEFKEDFKKSRMFANAPDNVINILENYPVTANFHQYCLTEETFAEYKMNELWNVISLNHDWNGVEFISAIEHKIYPFYGIQFRPEKNLYEFIRNRNISHLSQAIIAAQYFADFFINEARKNYNNFTNSTDESNSLIYNYNPTYTGPNGSAFAQQYYFEQQEYITVKGGALRNGLQLMLLIGVICLSALGSWRQTLLL